MSLSIYIAADVLLFHHQKQAVSSRERLRV